MTNEKFSIYWYLNEITGEDEDLTKIKEDIEDGLEYDNSIECGDIDEF